MSLQILLRPPRPPHRFGSIALQIAIIAVIGGLAYGAVINVAQNLARAHIASGFGFWSNTAGFDISQTLIGYSANASTFGRAFWVGLLNTLVVAALWAFAFPALRKADRFHLPARCDIEAVQAAGTPPCG